jgi:hypothetical protein
MKSVKIVFSSFLIVAALVTLSSFVASFDSTAFARVCYFYTQTNKRVAPGSGDSIDQSVLDLTSSWSTNPSSEPPTGCNSGAFLCAICFDNPPYSLQDAINFVKAYYISNQTFTHTQNIDPGVSNLKVYLKSTTP